MIITKKHAEKLMKQGRAVMRQYDKDGNQLPDDNRNVLVDDGSQCTCVSNDGLRRYWIIDRIDMQRTDHVRID